MISPLIRKVALAILGGSLGLFSSLIFWIIYIFQQFDSPVSDALRFRSALASTALILIAIMVLLYHRQIIEHIKPFFEAKDESDE